MKQATDNNFASMIADEPVAVVMFSAPWAGPCNLARPRFEAVAARFGNQITFAEFVIDDNPHIPSRYGLRAVPAFYIFRKGKPVVVKAGAVEEDVLVSICEGELPND